jgi:hypothetical protein
MTIAGKIDTDELQKAIENENNASIINTSHQQIKREKNDILQKLQIKGDALRIMHARLIGYKYAETEHDIRVGEYVRWISLKNPNKLSLTNGAHVCNIYHQQKPKDESSNNSSSSSEDSSNSDDEEKEDAMCIRCKTVRFGTVRFFNLNLSENIIFQKLTSQEWIILDALQHLK